MAFPVTSSRWCLMLATLVVGLSACRGTDGDGTPPPPPPAPLRLAFLTGVPTTTAGELLSPAIEVAFLDEEGHRATEVSGAVTVELPTGPTPAFTPVTVNAVSGVATFSGLRIDTAGSGYRLRATSGSIPPVQSEPFTIIPAAAARLELTELTSPMTSSTPGSARVTLRDAFGNVATGYTGTVHFSSGDRAATLPADHTFTEADEGSRVFGVTAGTVGTFTLAVTDGTFSDSASADVVPGAASSVELLGLPAELTAGTATSIRVVMHDAFRNVATGYTGTVQFASNDPYALLPGDYTFLPSDAGQKTFSVEPRKAGSRTLSVKASNVGSDIATTWVYPASPAALGFVPLPAQNTVRAALSEVRVELRDTYSNLTFASSPSVTLSLVGGNPASTLSGPTSVAPSEGVATFSGLSIDQEGLGFELVATAPGLTGATSQLFDIVDDLAPAEAFLTATTSSSSSVTVTWQAVGDDGMLGTAASQELRYSLQPITTDAAYASATPVALPAPQPPGTTESRLVTDLVLNTDHYFALRVVDGAGNASRSNSARVAGDRCLDVTCTPPAATCSASGRAVVTYAAACEPSTGTCQNTPTEFLCPAYQTCGAGACVPVTAGSQAGRIILSEFSALGSEFIELRNTTGEAIDVQGFSLRNVAGQEVTLRAVTDPNGTANTPVLVPANGVRHGIANPSGAIPGGVGFVYGDPGTPFSLADTGDALALYASGAAGTLEDLVDFRSFATDPNLPLVASHFVGFAGSSTQLDASVLMASGNDTATQWCVSFFPNGARGARITNTAGALNGSCRVAVINEVLIDPSGVDDGKAFVEIAGPGGAVIGGAKLTDVEGSGSSAGTINTEGDLSPGETDGVFVIPAGTRIPADGILLIADATTTGTTSVPGFTAGVDVLARDMDMENGGGDAIQLISAAGPLLDTVGHDASGNNLATNVASNGLALYETATALTPTAGVNNASPSLARSPMSTDTDHNRNDFHADPSPTPGAPNDAVSVTVTALSPDDALATTGVANISFTGTDFSPGLMAIFGSTTATTCTVQSPTSATCGAPANTGSAVARVDVKVRTPSNVGAADGVLTQGFTYTGVENGTKSAAEADFCNLQHPASFSVKTGVSTPVLYGQLFETGVTEAAGAPTGILAEVGHGNLNSNPTSNNSWRFFPATYNVQVGNNDEFMGQFTAPAVTANTNYAYTFRFSQDGGLKWTYCDLNGAGSNTGLSFESTQLGLMTVTP
ncbi:MAG: hypothetical protein ABW123_11990 [Cystobacter sp.]